MPQYVVHFFAILLSLCRGKDAKKTNDHMTYYVNY